MARGQLLLVIYRTGPLLQKHLNHMWSFLNDAFIDEEKAVLHCTDLSIQRGYAVFDFFKVVDSVPVFLDDHLDRFYYSAGETRLEVGYPKDEMKRIILELLDKNNSRDTGVRITATGGYSVDGYQLAKPNLLISLRPFSIPTPEQLSKGITLMSYEHQRQLPHIKTIDYLMAIWLQPLLKQSGADDILYHQERMVSECPRSNFFIVTAEKKIITPASNVLKGVIRKKLIEVARQEFEVEERDLSIEEIKTANEAFITSTTKIILPVRQIDEHTFESRNKIALHLRNQLLHLQAVE
jgi:branched-chain amino acid aminotransferase